MTKTEQLEWEARAGRAAGIAAILAALCLVGATIYLQASLTDRPDNTDELFEVIDGEKAAFIGSGVIQGIGLLLLIPVLGYLYRVTKYRRPQLIRVALVLAIAGPVTAAILGVLRQVELVSIAGDFLDESPRIGTQAAEDRAEDLIDDSTLPVISGVGFAANLSLGFSVVLLALNAMRAGLTSKFMGIIGIIIGVLYVLPVAGGPQIVQLFWLGALAALFLGKWPGGRGPAWESGEAIAWPSAAEVAQRREELGFPVGDGGGNGRGPGAEEPASVDPDTPRQDPRPGSRKRKKRKKR